MIGNDIVDLATASGLEGSRGRRWIDKVFTLTEQEHILKDGIDVKMAWRFWSMKESAYKAHRQLEANYVFNPLRIDSTILSKDVGLVKIEESAYYTSSIISREYIYTTAGKDRGGPAMSGVIRLSSDNRQSLEVRRAAITKAANELGLNLPDLTIRQNVTRTPRLYLGAQLLPLALSLTHHGRFAGYCFGIHA